MSCKKIGSNSCPKAGIKIHPTREATREATRETTNIRKATNIRGSTNTNEFREPFLQESRLNKPVSFQNTKINTLDLDLDNYSLEDLYHLFNIDNDNILSEESLKNAKQIVLKMHPDKSNLESKYFLFFSKAYKRLYGIYEFQNKSKNPNNYLNRSENDYYDEGNKNILANLIETNKEFKDPKNFNSWFNQTFEKHRLENPNENGYGDWLKSDDDFMSINENVTKGNMNDIFEQKKKQIQSMTVYNGVTDMFSSTFGGSLLDGSTTGSSEYTDLKEAYTQTLIPVTMDDYEKMPKFNNLSEYKAHRERVDVTPLSQKEAERQLLRSQMEQEQQSTALAFKYAKEAEKVKEKQNNFWGDLKQLTGW